jgi:hypothetical protein
MSVLGWLIIYDEGRALLINGRWKRTGYTPGTAPGVSYISLHICLSEPFVCFLTIIGKHKEHLEM